MLNNIAFTSILKPYLLFFISCQISSLSICIFTNHVPIGRSNP
nr:MAG TPA: hypothetical protein [Bacteriophage sp.]